MARSGPNRNRDRSLTVYVRLHDRLDREERLVYGHGKDEDLALSGADSDSDFEEDSKLKKPTRRWCVTVADSGPTS